MNIKELINELKLNISINKKLLREHISSLRSFFSSGNNQHITQYQHCIDLPSFARDVQSSCCTTTTTSDTIPLICDYKEHINPDVNKIKTLWRSAVQTLITKINSTTR